MMKKILFVTLIFLSLGSVAGHSQEDLSQLKTYLSQQFPPNAELQFDENQPISSLENFVLALHRPNLKFFKTQLRTQHYEFPQLPIVTALNTDSPSDIRIMKSPMFTDVTEDFLSLFYGIKVEGEEQLGLIEEIGGMFASLTYNGTIKNRQNPQPDTYSVELWWDTQWYRILTFQFGPEGLSQIIVKPIE